MSAEQKQLLDWFGQPIAAPDPNPCVRLYGKGPDGVKCSECAHLIRRRTGMDSFVFKCELRRNTKGPGTDHRARYSACSKFKQHEEETA